MKIFLLLRIALLDIVHFFYYSTMKQKFESKTFFWPISNIRQKEQVVRQLTKTSSKYKTAGCLPMQEREPPSRLMTYNKLVSNSLIELAIVLDYS